MKKHFTLTIILTVFLSIPAMAQRAHREVGSFSADFGIGLGTAGRSGYSFVLPPLKVDADYTVLNFGKNMSLSVGGYFCLGVDRLKSYDTTVTSFLVGPMVSFRYAIADDFNLFSRGIVGYIGVMTSDPVVNSYVRGSRAGAGFYLGGTWFFSPKMGLGAELGYGSPTNLGVHLTINI